MTAFQDLEERYSSGVYAKRGVTIVRGEGTRLWDDQGKEYIDCAAGMGVASLGHAHPTIAAAVATNVIDPITRFSGSAISPRTQAVTTADMFVPLVVPARWAEWSHAEDEVIVSQRGADDARRQVGVAAGNA